MGYRRRARESALQLLFQFDFTHDRPEDILSRYWEMNEAPPAQVAEMAEVLFRGSLARREEIDTLIRAHSHHWQIDRMSSVDRNILRVGVCELLMGAESQAPVIINEALEIAKKFSGDDSSRFINGVLDSIHLTLKAAPSVEPKPPRSAIGELDDDDVDDDIEENVEAEDTEEAGE